jgi:hypothetical protein
MTTWRGRDSRVTVNASTTEAIVAEIGDFEVSQDLDEIDISVFGDSWKKADIGQAKWTSTLNGFYDPADTDGQAVLEAAFKNGTLLTDIRFYYSYGEVVSDLLKYHHPDTVADATAGCYVTSFKTKTMSSNVATVSATFVGTGPLLLTESVVSA